MNNQKKELGAYVFFACLVVGALFLTSRIDLAFSKDLNNYAGPRAYPALVLGALLVMTLILIARACSQLKQHSQDELGLFNKAAATKVVSVFAATLIFAATFEPLGYLLTVPVVMFFTSYIIGGRNFVVMAITSIVSATVCLLVFRYGLKLVLPEGVLGIDAIF